MDVPILRKLTWKSVIRFGKYSDITVKQIYDLGHTGYLRWVYYNCSNITFVTEILECIHVYKQEEIIKPGTDKGKGEYITKMLMAKNEEKDRSRNLKNYFHFKKEKKAQLVTDEKLREKKYFSKSLLQAKNHNKFK